MPPSQMWTATWQAALLSTASLICGRHLMESAFDNPDAWEWESLKELYLVFAPRALLRALALNPLRYSWHLWLERRFPTRPGRLQSAVKAQGSQSRNDAEINVSGSKQTGLDNPQHTTISWFNTFAKWTIELTIGSIWRSTISALLGRLCYFDSSNVLFSSLWPDIYHELGFYFVSVAPFVSLLAFIIIPAYKRVVFEAAVGLAWMFFFGAILAAFTQWTRTLEGFEDAWTNVTVPANESVKLVDL